jgi:hypothetical protein
MNHCNIWLYLFYCTPHFFFSQISEDQTRERLETNNCQEFNSYERGTRGTRKRDRTIASKYRTSRQNKVDDEKKTTKRI